MLFTGHLHSEFEVKRKKSKYYSPGICTLNLKWKEKSRNIIHWASALWVFRPLVGVKRGQTITIVAEELISNKEVMSSSFFGLFQEVILSCPITCNCVVVCQNHGHKIEVQKNILSDDILRQLFLSASGVSGFETKKKEIFHNRANFTNQPRKWVS